MARFHGGRRPRGVRLAAFFMALVTTLVLPVAASAAAAAAQGAKTVQGGLPGEEARASGGIGPDGEAQQGRVAGRPPRAAVEAAAAAEVADTGAVRPEISLTMKSLALWDDVISSPRRLDVDGSGSGSKKHR